MQNLLFTCLFGSRLYGTQTPTSDLDYKHVYLPDYLDMLVGKPLANKVKKTNDVRNQRNSADDVDEEFIPLQVFARDFVAGQTYALELAFAVDGTHAGQTLFSTLFVKFVHQLRERFLTSNVKALMGYAVNQASLYSFKGERLNAVNDVLAVLKELEGADPAAKLSEHAEDSRWVSLQLKYPKYFKKTTYDVGGDQQRPCFTLLKKTLPFTNTVTHSVTVVFALKSKYGTRAEAATVDNVDWKATMHALRVVDEGLHLLEHHSLTFPFKPDYVAYLLSVKRGEVSLDEVRTALDEKLERLKQLEKETTLPPADEVRENFNTWLRNWMWAFYDHQLHE